MNIDKSIKYAGIAGVVTLILLLPTIIIYVLADMPKMTSITNTHAALITIINLMFYIIFMRGFVIAGDKFGNIFLKIMAYISISVSIIIHIFLVLSFTRYPLLEGYIPYTALIESLVSIPWGISLLKLKEKFGGIAIGAGVINILMGIPMIGPILLLVPGYILEIIILFKAAKLKQG